MQMFIGGAWVEGAGQMPVTDPTTGAVFDTVPKGGAAEADAAIRAALAAFATWKRVPMAERVRIQKTCATAMRAASGGLGARVLTGGERLAGLAGFVFTRDLARGLTLCEGLEAGSVWLNDIQRSSHFVPFGGMKHSGLGREKGRYGVESYLEYKTMYLSYEVPE